MGMTLLTLLLLPLPGWSKDINLFVIQRSKNTNEVQYQLRVNDRCQIVSAHPVSAFWQLREVSPDNRTADRPGAHGLWGGQPEGGRELGVV